VCKWLAWLHPDWLCTSVFIHALEEGVAGHVGSNDNNQRGLSKKNLVLETEDKKQEETHWSNLHSPSTPDPARPYRTGDSALGGVSRAPLRRRRRPCRWRRDGRACRRCWAGPSSLGASRAAPLLSIVSQVSSVSRFPGSLNFVPLQCYPRPWLAAVPASGWFRAARELVPSKPFLALAPLMVVGIVGLAFRYNLGAAEVAAAARGLPRVVVGLTGPVVVRRYRSGWFEVALLVIPARPEPAPRGMRKLV
jgi:hypothetical protein